MHPAVSKLYGKLSARSKLEALAVVILLALCVAAYQRGRHNGAAKAKIAMIEKQRKANADTIRARADSLKKARAASDSARQVSEAATRAAGSFVLRPTPARPLTILQTPANAGPVPDLRPLVAELYAVIANRDSALVLEKAAVVALASENAKLRLERKPTDDLIASLNRQIALDIQEINELKRLKTPRFGVKTGIAIGAATALAVEAGIRSLKK